MEKSFSFVHAYRIMCRQVLFQEQAVGQESVRGQSRDLFGTRLRGRNGVDADTNPPAPMVTPQL